MEQRKIGLSTSIKIKEIENFGLGLLVHPVVDEETKDERQGIYNNVHKSYLCNLYSNFTFDHTNITYRSGTMKGLWQTQYWTCILINTMLNIIFIQNITVKILVPWIFSVHFEEIHDFNINIYVFISEKKLKELISIQQNWLFWTPKLSEYHIKT